MASDALQSEEVKREREVRPLAPGPETIKAYIRAHPELIADDPDLLNTIVPSSYSDDGVVYDVQRFAIDRLKGHGDEIVRQRDRAIATLRSNTDAWGVTQKAVLTILEARNFEDMIRVITEDLGPLLGVDRVLLCVEESHEGMIDDMNAAAKLGVKTVPECVVDTMIDEGTYTTLKGDTRGPGMIWGKEADDIRSYAFVRLAVSPIAPPALLALGSYAPNGFHEDQGTELLTFVAQVIERQVRAWLGLPEA